MWQVVSAGGIVQMKVLSTLWKGGFELRDGRSGFPIQLSTLNHGSKNRHCLAYPVRAPNMPVAMEIYFEALGRNFLDAICPI